MGRRASKLRRVTSWALAVLLGLPAVLLLGGLDLLRWPAIQDAGRALLVRRLREIVPGLELGFMAFDRRGEVVIRGLKIRDSSGQPALSLRGARVRLSLGALLQREIRVKRALLLEPRLELRRLPDGRWNLTALIRPRPAARSASGPPSAWRVRLEELRLLGGTAVLPRSAMGRALRVARLDLEGSAQLGGGEVVVRLASLHLQGQLDRQPIDLEARGEAQLRSGWVQGAVRLRSAGLLQAGPLSLEATLRGPPRQMVVRARLASASAGSLRMGGWVGVPLRYDLRLGLDDLRPRHWRTELPSGLARGELRARGRGVPLGPRAFATLEGALTSSLLAGVPISKVSLHGRLQARHWQGEGEVRLPGLRLWARSEGDLLGDITVDVHGELHAGERLPVRLGALHGAGRFEAHLHGRPGNFSGRVQVALANLAGHGFALHGLHLEGGASGLPTNPLAEISVGASMLRAGAVYRDLRLRAAGGRRAVNVQAAARGHGVRAYLRASGGHQGRTWRAQLKRLELHHPALELSLRRPTQLSWSSRRGITLEQTRLAVWGGDVELGGRWQPGRSPRGELQLHARRVRLPGGGPLSLDLQARLQAQQLTGRLGARLEQGASLQLAAKLPLRRDWQPDRRRPLALQIQLTDLDLRLLRAVLPRGPALAGRLSLTSSLSGSLVDPRLRASFQLHDGSAEGLGGLELVARLSAAEQRSDLALDLRRWNKPLLHLEGQLGVAASALATPWRSKRQLLDAPVRLEVEAPSLALDLLTRLGRLPQRLRGQLTLRASLDGSLRQPRAALRVVTHGLSYGPYRPDWIEAELHVDSAEQTRLRGGLQLRGDPLISFQAESGSLGSLLGDQASHAPLRGRLVLPGFWLSALPSIRPDLVGFGGQLQGEAWFDGSLGQPGVHAALRVRDPELRGYRLERLEMSGALGKGRLRANLELRQLGPGGLQANVEANLAARQRSLQARLTARDLELAQLQGFFPKLRALGGLFDATLSASGNLSRPQLVGALQLNEGRFGLIGGPTLEHIKLRARLHRDEIRLEQLLVPFGKGKLKVSGLARMQGLWPARLEAKARAEDLPLALVGVANATFAGKLSFYADLVRGRGLAGQLTLEQGLVTLAGLPGSMRKLYPIGPLAGLHYIGSLEDVPHDAPPASGGKESRAELLRRRRAPSFPVRLQLTARSLLIRGREMSAELAAELRLQPKGRDQILLGEVRLGSGGWVEILKRRYDIEQGLVRFGGKPQPDPVLAITLTRRFPEARIYVRAIGTAREPQLELSSDPPIYDRAQLISLVLAGHPTMSSAGGVGSSLGVASVMLQLLFGRLADAIVPGVGLDVLRVGEVTAGEQSGPGTANERLAELEVGKYLTERLYVGYRRLFGAPQNENSNEGRLEYRLSSSWSLESVFGDAAAGGIDLFWTHFY